MTSSDEEKMLYDYTKKDLEVFMSVAKKLAAEAGDMIAATAGKQQRGAAAHKTGEKYCAEETNSLVVTETDAAVEKHLVRGFSKVNFAESLALPFFQP